MTETSFDGEFTALFRSMWQATPTFHRYEHSRSFRPEAKGVSTDYTACGLVVASHDSTTRRLRDTMTYVPMRHALLFGKPCRNCFP